VLARIVAFGSMSTTIFDVRLNGPVKYDPGCTRGEIHQYLLLPLSLIPFCIFLSCPSRPSSPLPLLLCSTPPALSPFAPSPSLAPSSLPPLSPLTGKYKMPPPAFATAAIAVTIETVSFVTPFPYFKFNKKYKR
jgi:hypothetical protein